MPNSSDATLLRPQQVAQLFGVDPQTIVRWSESGDLPAYRTKGGHRRFRREDVERLLESGV